MYNKYNGSYTFGGFSVSKYGGPLETAKYFHALGRISYANQTLSTGYTGYEQVFKSTTRRKPIINDCSNVKQQWVFKPHTAVSGRGSTVTKVYPYWIDKTNYGSLLPTYNVSGMDPLLASNRGWYHLQPRLEGEAQMLNFLFELKDFRDIATRLVKIKPHKFLTYVQRLQRHHARKNARYNSITESAAEIWLMNTMMVLPTYNDMVDIMATAQLCANEALRQFKDKGLELQSRHYSEVLEENNQMSSSYSGTSRGRISTAKFTSTLHYKYGYREISDTLSFAKQWGLTGKASHVYNALPFTFLLDYFINFADALAAIELDTDLELDPFQYSESILAQSISGRYVAGDQYYPTALITGELVAPQWPQTDAMYANVVVPKVGTVLNGMVASDYMRVRKPWPRRGLYMPKISLPKTSQGINMLALARAFL
jgi:hypothetical protein